MPQSLSVPNAIDRRPVVRSHFGCAWTACSPDVAWGRLVGELDAGGVPRLERALREPRARARLVVLDLRSLERVDEDGVGAIVAATLGARRSGRRLILLRGPPEVDRCFRPPVTCDEVEVFDLDAGSPAVLVLLELAPPGGGSS